jgi:putative Mg2+ transporter-C (MgtC) family protein
MRNGAMVLPRTVWIEFFGDVHLYFGLGVQIVVSIILAGLIGLEREMKMKPAGVKTNILICLGATLYTSMSLLTQAKVGLGDPTRVGAQIVSGIGFLGAGAILHGGAGVTGLTTAATIWVVAAIGFTIGCGYPVIASLFTLTFLSILTLINPLLKRLVKNRYFHFEVLSAASVRDSIYQFIQGDELSVKSINEEEVPGEVGTRILHVVVKGTFKEMGRLSEQCSKITHVKRVKFYEHEDDTARRPIKKKPKLS